ncbi:MAG: DUF853 family protein [Thermoplasmata archaeon]|nr:DUF853 family protein [Thermoplasmata archaeon]
MFGRGRVRLAFRLATGGAGRAAVLARVASLVAASPAGTAVLVEVGFPDGSLQLIPSGEDLRHAMEAAAREFPGALRLGPAGPAPSPPSGFAVERAGRYVARGEPVRSASARPVNGEPDRRVPARPDREIEDDPPWTVPLPSGIWLGAQHHWFSTGDGRVRVESRYRLAVEAGPASAGAIGAAAALATPPTHRLGPEGMVAWGPHSRRARRAWRSGRPSGWSTSGLPPLTAAEAPAGVEWVVQAPFPTTEELAHHLVVLGASGSGKTTFLARLAARAITEGTPVLLFDVHGDLGPAVLARLSEPARRRLVALDPTDPAGPGPGIPVLDGTGRSAEREAAFVVAALKRLSAEGSELYWGFRLERIFETLVRVVQEEGGTLVDLYALLQDPRRRESSRLATRSPVVAGFLDELPAILRRNPEFLWPAAARLAKVVLSPALTALLAPAPGRAVPFARLLRSGGRSLAVRIPTNVLGPEASAVAATLLLTRAYLELAEASTSSPATLLVLDEVAAFSPRLVAEILAEGRKFGIRAALATQFPERLAPEVRQAAAGSAGTHVVFRVPAPAAAATGIWVGLTAESARRALPRLPDGWAVVAPGRSGLRPRLIVDPAPSPRSGAPHWRAAVAVTRAEFGAGTIEVVGPRADEAEESVLLALYAAEGPRSLAQLVGPAAGTDAAFAAARLERLAGLERRSLVEGGPDGLVITPAGARYLGATADHGATIEGTEHRRLLLQAFRIFARHGERLELLRQGRYDTRLPDARLRLVGPELRAASPAALRAGLERRQTGWAWGYFGGRDVFVEAEVSGAERPERIRRGVAKAARAGAFALFLVSDARRARRVRGTLDRAGTDRRQWAVWTLRDRSA